MQQLKKEIGFKTLMILTINAILGTGIFFLPALGAMYAGPASIISWILMSFVAIFISLYFAELVSMFPKAGGTYEFVKQSFGEVPSFLIGWLSWIIANITTSMLIVGAIYYLLPGASFSVSLGLSLFFILIFNFINYRGIKQSSKMVLIFGIITITILMILILPGIFYIDTANYSPFFVFPSSAIFLAIFFIAETYFGWETITFLAEEVKDARRILPKALVLATLVISLIAIALTTVSLGVVNWQVFSTQKAPLASLAAAIFGTDIAKILSVIIFIPIIGTAASWIISSPRLLFAMSRDKVFISSIRKIHTKYGTPHVAILFQTVMAIAITLIALGSYTYLLALLIPLVLITYSVILACVIKLRISKPKTKRYFKAPFGKIGPAIIILFNFYLLYLWVTHESALNMIFIAIALILLGLPAYIIIKLQTDRKFIEKFFDRIGLVFDIYVLRILIRGKHRDKIIKNINIKSDHIVLDYGCAQGLNTRKVAKLCDKVVAADISAKQLKKAIKKTPDIPNIIYLKLSRAAPFKRSMFDRIIAVVSINYFVRPEKELKKLHSSLKRGGKAGFLALIAPGITTHPFLKHDRMIKTIFKEAGFKNTRVERKGKLIQYIYITAKK